MSDPIATIAQQHSSAPPDCATAGPAWRNSLLLSLILLSGLSWLLARLVFLPLYMGLFFYLVAGLLVSAVTFRIARPARPISRGRLIRGISLVALGAWSVSICWEYRDRVSGIAAGTRFYEAKNNAVARGRSPRSVETQVADAMRQRLRDEYPPGGVIGYVRWVVSSGEMQLGVDAITDTVNVAHRRRAWLLRSAASVVLLGFGLWFGYESLRSPQPVSNLLVPGEEAPDQD